MFYGGAQFQATDNPVTREEAIPVIHRAIEHDINYLDCADIYGAYGTAEKIIGEAIAGYDREHLVLASKVMMPMSRNELDRGLNRKHVMKSIDRSNANFGADYIDLYYAHRYDPHTPLVEVIKSMNILIDEGKILHWGTSNWSPAELERTHMYCRQHGYEGPIVDQTKYHLLRRYPSEMGLPYTLDEYGMGLVPYKILNEGMFSGMYANKSLEAMSDGEIATLTGQLPNLMRPLTQDLLDRLTKYSELAASLDISAAQLSYAFTLTLTQVSSALFSTRNPDRVEQNIAALDISLDTDTIAQINQLFPFDYVEYDTYYRVSKAPGPDIIGKIGEDMMRF
jgi:aryl-alcohol dehydrogenase-like predicted oxidoreductase